MEYYCIMVKTGEEEAFKKRAMCALQDDFPEVKFFFFHRTLRSNRGEYFERPIFPGYLFFQVETLSAEFFSTLRRLNGFYRILQDNTNPTRLAGPALEELKIFMNNGEHWGISKVNILPGMKVQAVSGPFCGLEGNVYRVNRKKKSITIMSSLTQSVKYIDIVYEDAQPVD